VKTFLWWLYVIIGCILLAFLAPALISTADTISVLCGVILLVGYGVWTWNLWLCRFVFKLKEMYEKASRD
jgi:uncharacterized membrane protein